MLIMYTMRIPAFTKIEAAIDSDTLCWFVAHAIRSEHVKTLAIEKPPISAEGKKKWPLLALLRKRPMFEAKKVRYRAMKMARAGTSGRTDGTPPIPAVCGGYGGCEVVSSIVAGDSGYARTYIHRC